MQKDDAAAMFLAHVRGLLAHALLTRDKAPTEAQWKFIRHDHDVDLRTLGEWFSDLGYRPTLALLGSDIADPVGKEA